MARNYASLPHEYLEEMDILSDAEFGRLCRALLRYSMDGKEGQLEGAEKVLWKRVKMQEDRFQENYKKQVSAKSDAGRKGASKRWQSIAKNGTPMADNSKNGQTETETETETNISPPSGGGDTRAREQATAAAEFTLPPMSRAVEAFCNKINPTPSERSLAELESFETQMGSECCLRAIDEALDARVANWNYIRKILRSKLEQGVRCIADWDKLEEKRETKAKQGDNDDRFYV